MVTAASQVVNSKSRLRFMITTGWSSTHSVVTFCKVQTLEGWFDCLFDLGFMHFGHLTLEAHAVIPITTLGIYNLAYSSDHPTSIHLRGVEVLPPQLLAHL